MKALAQNKHSSAAMQYVPIYDPGLAPPSAHESIEEHLMPQYHHHASVAGTALTRMTHYTRLMAHALPDTSS